MREAGRQAGRQEGRKETSKRIDLWGMYSSFAKRNGPHICSWLTADTFLMGNFPSVARRKRFDVWA